MTSHSNTDVFLAENSNLVQTRSDRMLERGRVVGKIQAKAAFSAEITRTIAEVQAKEYGTACEYAVSVLKGLRGRLPQL